MRGAWLALAAAGCSGSTVIFQQVSAPDAGAAPDAMPPSVDAGAGGDDDRDTATGDAGVVPDSAIDDAGACAPEPPGDGSAPCLPETADACGGIACGVPYGYICGDHRAPAGATDCVSAESAQSGLSCCRSPTCFRSSTQAQLCSRLGKPSAYECPQGLALDAGGCERYAASNTWCCP